ncbi:MAG: glycosyltransferase family 2 protein [Mycobacteriales bacterium]
MTRRRVDVGIVTWNTRDLTLRAIDAALASTGVDVRVLVRDNGSTDGTAEAVASRHPDVLVDVGHNVGFAAGVNALLARSDAPWFLTLNSDAWPEPDALRAMVELATREQRAAAVAPLLLRPDGSLEPSAHAFPRLLTAAALPLSHRRSEQLLMAPGWRHDQTREVDWAVGAALLLRRAAVAEIGALDDSFFMYGEDLEWCWRAREAGWEVWFTPAAVVRHVGNASGAQRFGPGRDQVAIANAATVVAKYRGRGYAMAWRLLNALTAGRAWARARSRGDRDLAAHYRRQLSAHLGRAR